MAVLAAILPFVSRSSALALCLYRLATTETEVAKNILKTAKSINNVSLIMKQVGTFIKENDRIPSSEAFETLEDVLEQCAAILNEFESMFSYQEATTERGHGHRERPRRLRLSPSSLARLQYLLAHLESLGSTLAVMLQTLFSAQSVIWARVRPTVSPTQCAAAVANEKQQLETLIIEQQISILSASKLYEFSRSDAKLLMENDSSQTLVALDKDAPQPSNLFKYQDKFIASLDIHNSDEEQWIPAICSVSMSQLERLLDRWTRLRLLEESLRDDERKVQAQKRETQQAFVESDSEEDDFSSLPRLSANSDAQSATPTAHRPGSNQPLFSETTTLPIPVKSKHHGPTVPLSPASSYGASPRSSLGNNLSTPLGSSVGAAPVTPRTSITTLPVEAAAAVEAKDKDYEINLEIPWTLRTRRHHWKYIDNNLQRSDADSSKPSSQVLSDRNTWTEILASWVCKEAIQEAGYQFTQVQKERRDGRRTRFETCFCIEKALRFEQVKSLVERTVEIYRKTQATTLPPREKQARRSSFERRLAPTIGSPKSHDRNRTPRGNGHPPLDRSYTAFPPPAPPPLDRSISMPGPTNFNTNPQASSLYPLSIQPAGTAPYPTESNPYVLPCPQSPLYASPQTHYPPQGSQQSSFDPRHLHPQTNAYPPPPQNPHRPSFSNRSKPRDLDLRRDYYSTSGTSDSDSVTSRKERKHNSRSRRRGDGGKKEAHKHGGATKAMMGVAGLTALLDGLVGI